MSLQQAGTGEVWLFVQAELKRQAFGRATLGATLGAAPDLWDLVNQAMSAAYSALQAAEQGIRNPAGVLHAAYRQLLVAYRLSIAEGFHSVADGIRILSERVADAIRELGNSWGDVLQSFLGASPAQFALGGAVLVALGLGAAAVVLSGAGGQQALVTLASRRLML